MFLFGLNVFGFFCFESLCALCWSFVVVGFCGAYSFFCFEVSNLDVLGLGLLLVGVWWEDLVGLLFVFLVFC